MTLREHYEAAIAQELPGWEAAFAALEACPMPDDGEGLWAIFLSLHPRRPAGGAGPAAIPFAEIEAFQRLQGFALEPWELRAVTAMDQAFLDFAHWQTSTGEHEKARIAKRYALPEEPPSLIREWGEDPPHPATSHGGSPHGAHRGPLTGHTHAS